MSRSRRQQFTEINITPLTDIFLVLLIIMMVIAPMLDAEGLKLAVPTVGTSAEQEKEPKVIQVQVTAEGQYLVNSQAVPADGLRAKLSQMKQEFPEGVIIETAPQALHGMVVKAMDAARGAGIDKMAVTQSESAPEPSEG